MPPVGAGHCGSGRWALANDPRVVESGTVRLEITKRADLAVRAMAALGGKAPSDAAHPANVKAGDLAAELGTTPAFCTQVVAPLVRGRVGAIRPGPDWWVSARRSTRQRHRPPGDRARGRPDRRWPLRRRGWAMPRRRPVSAPRGLERRPNRAAAGARCSQRERCRRWPDPTGPRSRDVKRSHQPPDEGPPRDAPPTLCLRIASRARRHRRAAWVIATLLSAPVVGVFARRAATRRALASAARPAALGPSTRHCALVRSANPHDARLPRLATGDLR